WNGLTASRGQDVVRGQHQHTGFDLGLGRERNMDRHLVAVEVCVERGADQRVNFDGFSLHQYRLECLNTKAVQSRSAVQQNRMVLNDLLKDVPNNGLLLLDHLLRLRDGGAMAGLFEAVIDERLKQFERHLLGETALMELEFRTNHDGSAARGGHAV